MSKLGAITVHLSSITDQPRSNAHVKLNPDLSVLGPPKRRYQAWVAKFHAYFRGYLYFVTSPKFQTARTDTLHFKKLFRFKRNVVLVRNVRFRAYLSHSPQTWISM